MNTISLVLFILLIVCIYFSKSELSASPSVHHESDVDASMPKQRVSNREFLSHGTNKRLSREASPVVTRLRDGSSKLSFFGLLGTMVKEGSMAIMNVVTGNFLDAGWHAWEIPKSVLKFFGLMS